MKSGVLPDHEGDSEESLISQFETTLTIRPSPDYTEDHDLSIDHTTFIHGTESTYESRHTNIQSENHSDKLQTKSCTSSDRLKLTDSKITVKFPHTSEIDHQPLESTSQITDTDLLNALKPSESIDLGLTRFRRALNDFLVANPQIEKDSPKFELASDKTLVLLSPYSSEHAFGRRWVSKSYLSTIFERPQRLLAACLGISAAFTMYPHYYEIKNSTKKGSLFSNHVRKVHGKSWPKKLFELCLESYDKLRKDEIEVPADWNTGDIYLTPKTITALEGVLGTIEMAVDSLFQSEVEDENHNLAFVAIRPPGHHSHACLPSGFCMLNNAQIGTEYAFDAYGVTHCAILDIDLHHGDGSQDICWERAGFCGDHGKSDDEFDDAENNPRNEYGKKFSSLPKVGYFSLHDVKSYPTELGFASKQNIKNASLCIMDHDLNLWNVHLQEWATEEEFYKHYQTKYVAILNRANQFLNQSKKQHEALQAAYMSDLAKFNKSSSKSNVNKQQMHKPTPPPPFKPLIIISAGFDASEYENAQMQRHSVNVPTSFYAKFTEDVVKLAQIHTKGKVLSFLEGGYSDGALISGIFSHLIGFTNVKRDEIDSDSLWNGSWGSEHVLKELTRGCKRSWIPYKNPRTETTIWANEVIKLGRSMMPNAILPPDYLYSHSNVGQNGATSRPFEATKGTKMLREIMDAENLEKSLALFSSKKSSATESRHTRSYYSRNSKET